jgi:hypothetical protein
MMYSSSGARKCDANFYKLLMGGMLKVFPSDRSSAASHGDVKGARFAFCLDPLAVTQSHLPAFQLRTFVHPGTRAPGEFSRAVRLT